MVEFGRLGRVLLTILGEQCLPLLARLLPTPAHRAFEALANAIVAIRGNVDAHFDRGEYIDCLKKLAGLKVPVDDFFEKVLVNAKEPKVRANRLSLLSELSYLLNKVADLAKLAA